jgi:hypothetical protein
MDIRYMARISARHELACGFAQAVQNTANQFASVDRFRYRTPHATIEQRTGRGARLAAVA